MFRYEVIMLKSPRVEADVKNVETPMLKLNLEKCLV